MAGNREAYEQAMNAGHNAAWDQDWTQAIAYYGRAIQEFPEDPDAHIHMGLALLEAGRLKDSLNVYTRAHQLAPDDPIPLEKSADVLERMGRLREAAQQYISVAEIYLGQRDVEKAIGNWERATRLTPGLIQVHAKLAQAYEKIGDNRKAIREYLTLAFNFQRISDTENANRAVQRALRIEPKNSQALNTLRALESGGELTLPPPDEGQAGASTKTGNGAAPETPIRERQVGDSDPLGPMGEAMNEALGLLASFVIESGELDSSGGDALQGLELQRQGINAEAIAAYLRAEPRLRHPALKMNLGGLLLMADKPDEAVKHLGEATTHPRLMSGAFHALGQAYYKLNKHKQATRFLLQSLQAVDTSLAVSKEEAAELKNVYEQLMAALDGQTDETMEAINKRFLGLLSGKDWKQRVALSRTQLMTDMKAGESVAIEKIIEENPDALADAATQIDRYMQQNLFTLAMDEAHRAVELSPHYLPAHLRMADIMMREGRVRNAISKYNIVAKTYMVRSENDRAAKILSDVLEMAPLDISVRESLIELLEGEEKMDEALDQYMELADTYHQLGNFDMSREKYLLAERIAIRIKATPDRIVRIKHRVADIDQMRLDTRKAQKTYEDILQLVPDDERAHRMLIDLSYRQGNQLDGLRRLDQLLGIYAKKRQVTQMTRLLEELVTVYPNDTALRSRLAAIYQQLGRKRDAIVQYDALAELQLEAGLQQEACKTIRQIIALGPEHMDDYKRLLSQLGC